MKASAIGGIPAALAAALLFGAGTPFAKLLIDANIDRVIWGTDWPHPDSTPRAGRKPTDVAPFLQIDDAQILNLLAVWAPDAEVRKKILVDNPERLYGF